MASVEKEICINGIVYKSAEKTFSRNFKVNDWYKRVRLLVGTPISITKQEYDRILEMTKRQKSDFIVDTEENLYTFCASGDRYSIAMIDKSKEKTENKNI